MKLTIKHRSTANLTHSPSRPQLRINKSIKVNEPEPFSSRTDRSFTIGLSSNEQSQLSASLTEGLQKQKGILITNPDRSNGKSTKKNSSKIWISSDKENANRNGKLKVQGVEVTEWNAVETNKSHYNLKEFKQKCSAELKEAGELKGKEIMPSYRIILNPLKETINSVPQRNPIHSVIHMQNKRMEQSTQINTLSAPIIPSKRIYSMDDFSLGHKIGRGRFGNVYIAQEKATKCIFALKMMSVKKVLEEDMLPQIIAEIKIQSYLNHPNVLKMYGFFSQDDQICMILEYANEKCLFKHMRPFNKLKALSESKAAAHVKQVINALKYLQTEDVLHRDIKPENILLCEGVAKIGDFGWSAYSPFQKRSTFCGTLDYVSPQIIRGDLYDNRADVWSLGVLIYELVTGHAPFEMNGSENETLNRILQGDLPLPSDLSAPLRKLILRVLTSNPETRLSLEEIEESQWMKLNHQDDSVTKGIWNLISQI